MNTSRYSIGELAKAAKVTPRTIRYYAADGLLPPPLSEGRYAVYTGAHLARLQLIQRLKSAFLPLSAIRAHIEKLSDAQIRELIGDNADSPEGETKERLPAIRVRRAEAGSGQSSLDFLAQVLAVTGQGAANSPAPAGEERRKRALLVSPVFQPNGDNAAVAADDSAPQAAWEVWERVRINTRLELHVRAPLTPEERQKIERITAQARALFPEDS